MNVIINNNRYLLTYRFLKKTVMNCKICKLITNKVTLHYSFQNLRQGDFTNIINGYYNKYSFYRFLTHTPPTGFFLCLE